MVLSKFKGRSVDVDIDQDDKDQMFKALHGPLGFIVIKNTGVEHKQVYWSAIVHLKIDKSTKKLTAFKASKVIWQLATGGNHE